MRDLETLILHPFFWAMYMVLAVLGHNINEVIIVDTRRALFFSLFATTIVLLSLKIIYRDWHRAAIICSTIVILFFTYGHVYHALRMNEHLGEVIGRHRYLAPLWVGLLGVACWWTLKRVKNPKSATVALNGMALVALVFPIFQISSHEIKKAAALPRSSEVSSANCQLSLPVDAQPPDVYYIILDGYTHADVLLTEFDYDNKPFLTELAAMGFYVAEWSQSNYSHTELSLPSSLNLNYLEAIDARIVAGKGDRTIVKALAIDNVVRRQLECLGYQEIVFESGYFITEWQDADQFLCCQVSRALNPFESMIIYNSAGVLLSLIDGFSPVVGSQDADDNFSEHRSHVLCVLDTIDDVTFIPGPKFVFAHIISPHEPYVLGANGEHIQPAGTFTLGMAGGENADERDRRMYRNQLIYMNKRIPQILKAIIEGSETPPIIIVQSNHGKGGISPEAKMAILNAYYLPSAGMDLLYETITPGNTFRLIFDTYMGGDYGLLTDLSYYSEKKDPFNFIIITNPQAASIDK